MQTIYLDHNATTPVDPVAVEAMRECYLNHFANPASQHQMGQRSRQVLEDARDTIADILNVRLGRGDRLIFTSGGTESNNLALMGLPTNQNEQVLVSSIEHPSTLGAAKELERRRFEVQYLPVLESGKIDIEILSKSIQTRTQLVSVMLANNETGVLQPAAEIARICRENDIVYHTDAVQAIGKIVVDFQELGASTMSIAAHKFNGPVGIGALAIRKDVPIRPTLFGGSQQLETRPGTEMMALATGMATALKQWQADSAVRRKNMFDLRVELERRLLAEISNARVNGCDDRLPNTLNISFPGINRQALLMALDFSGVACSTGSACASGSSEPSPVLIAMNLPKDVISGSIRLSLGHETTKAEIALAGDRILKSVNDLRNS